MSGIDGAIWSFILIITVKLDVIYAPRVVSRQKVNKIVGFLSERIVLKIGLQRSMVWYTYTDTCIMI